MTPSPSASRWLEIQTERLTALFDTQRGALLNMQSKTGSPWPEIIQAVYLHVRRPDWSTPLPRISMTSINIAASHFSLEWNASYDQPDVPFQWSGRLNSLPDGGFRFETTGRASQDFLTNRTGLCLLFPQEWEGFKAEIETADGTLQPICFPTAIQRLTPFPPFRKLLGSQGEVAFSGDLFEIEDQRNWGDASFKAYPLVSPQKPYKLTVENPFTHAVEFHPPSPEPQSHPSVSRVHQFRIPPIDFESPLQLAPPVDTRFLEDFLPANEAKITFSIHPQVHIFDETLIVRNAESLRTIVRALRARFPGRSIHPVLTSALTPELQIPPEVERAWAVLAILAASEGGASQISLPHLHPSVQNDLLTLFPAGPNPPAMRHQPSFLAGIVREFTIHQTHLLINPTPVPVPTKQGPIPGFSIAQTSTTSQT